MKTIAENIIYHNTFHKFNIWDRIKILLGRELMVQSEIETEGEAKITGQSSAKAFVAPLFSKKRKAGYGDNYNKETKQITKILSQNTE